MPNHDWDSGGWDDEPWDENQWEAFLRENDKRADRYMELLHDFLQHHPRPDSNDSDAFEAWTGELRIFIEDKGWTRDDIVLPFLWLDGVDDLDEEIPDMLDFDVPEENESFLGGGSIPPDPFADSFELDSFRQLSIYQQASTLTGNVMDWADALPGEVKDSTLVQFCSNVMQIPAKIAKGHALGYERETIGGNIACVKRALASANAALTLLQQLREEVYVEAAVYRELYEATYEMRNALGIYVQELRAQFNLGID